MKEIKEQRTPLRADLPKLLSQLETPPEEFTPVPFWFFNDRPDEERIRKQLADYKEKGVDAIVLHPRIGIPQELAYLSEDYFQAVRYWSAMWLHVPLPASPERYLSKSQGGTAGSL